MLTILLVIGLFIIVMIIIKILSVVKIFKEKLQGIIENQKKSLIFNGMIRGVSLAYISICFQVSQNIGDSISEKEWSLIVIAQIVCLTLFLIAYKLLTGYFLIKNFK